MLKRCTSGVDVEESQEVWLCGGCGGHRNTKGDQDFLRIQISPNGNHNNLQELYELFSHHFYVCVLELGGLLFYTLA